MTVAVGDMIIPAAGEKARGADAGGRTAIDTVTDDPAGVAGTVGLQFVIIVTVLGIAAVVIEGIAADVNAEAVRNGGHSEDGGAGVVMDDVVNEMDIFGVAFEVPAGAVVGGAGALGIGKFAIFDDTIRR